MTSDQTVPGSFRDPSGFLFFRDGVLYRQVNQRYRDNYDLLRSSGLYDKLVAERLLIPHEEVDLPAADPTSAYRIIRPEVVGFISYPYEWCFSQLKDAALLTLKVQQLALDFGLSLKDASAYNVQFHRGNPILIDTLSFEKYPTGEPWVGYRQFCQHFLAPLTLMSYTDVRLSALLRNFIDGLPLDLTVRLLPGRTKLSFSLLTHLHLHAKSQKRHAETTVKPTGHKVSLLAMRGLSDSLRSAIARLSWEPGKTEWGDYYDHTNYSPASREHKKQLVTEFLSIAKPRTVWDLGGNVGLFSRLAADLGADTVCFDIDPAAVEKNYRQCRDEKQTKLLPLMLDLTNPSPDLGWANNERMSVAGRGPVDVVLALALVHHLAITNNVPLRGIARYLRSLGRSLIIEFVPKNDSQVQRLLATREDIFSHYDQDEFERSFETEFTIEQRKPIAESARTLYLMQARESD